MASRFDIETTIARWASCVRSTRRHGLGAIAGALLSGGVHGAADGAPSPEGPCGDGSGKSNRCRKNSQCCTGICDASRRRCRCLSAGSACTETRNCCLRNGVQLACSNGVCAVPAGNGWINQTTFGSTGTGSDNFFDPYNVAMSSSLTTAWIADYLNNRVSIWTRSSSKSKDWSNQTTFGVKGSGAGELYGPAGVALTPDTLTALVADYANDRISIWTRPDATSTAWSNPATFGGRGGGASKLRRPSTVAMSQDVLTAWVADTDNNRVSVWTRPDAASTVWTNQTTFGSAGSLANEFTAPVGLVVAGDGLTAWVGDSGNNRVSVWTRPDGASTAWTNATIIGSGPGDAPNALFGPLGLALSGDGLTLWVADQGNQRISVWARPDASSTAWANVTTFGSFGSGASQFEEPAGVAVAANGRTLLVADYGNNRISVWRRQR